MSGRLTRRTWVALAILLLAIPALMAVFVCVWDERKYYLTSLLLDEPTKGMDGAFKAEFGALLRTLCAQGTAVCIVSHDVEFCAQYADRCGLLFRGEVVTENDPRAFFSGNYFYTTAAARIARSGCSKYFCTP